MNETLTRLLTALVLIPLTAWFLYKGEGLWAAYVSIAAVICELEFFSIMEAKNYKPMKSIAIAITVALIIVAHVAGMELAAGMLTAGILALLVYQVSSPTSGSAINNISVTMTGVIYVGWLLSHGVYLRHLTTPDGQADIGLFAVLYLMATTFLYDTGAYFAGRAFGNHPIAPKISPKKTWEGLLGGVLTAGCVGAASKYFTEWWMHDVPYSYEFLAVLGLLIGVVGFLGDLVESVLKRDADVKDSGNLLPGHGGLLDRIDGLLFTLPFSFYAFLLANRMISSGFPLD